MEKEGLRKLFCGGLHYNTTSDILKQHFEQFGNVLDAFICLNPVTMESKHFGFITFENAICVLDALASRPHKVGGRAIDVRRAIPKKNDSETALVRTKMLFVGGVASNATEHDIASYINEGHVING
eukprot:gene16474-18111_t